MFFDWNTVKEYVEFNNVDNSEDAAKYDINRSISGYEKEDAPR